MGGVSVIRKVKSFIQSSKKVSISTEEKPLLYLNSTLYTATTLSFHPAQISNLSLWLDASDETTFYDSVSGGSLVVPNGLIARWEDKSGNGNHVTGSGGQRPTRRVEALNGLDGTDWVSGNKLQAGNQFIAPNSDFTVFVVANGNSVGASGIYHILFSIGNHLDGLWSARYIASVHQRMSTYNNAVSINGSVNSFPNNFTNPLLFRVQKKVGGDFSYFQDGGLHLSLSPVDPLINGGFFNVGGPVGNLSTARSWAGRIFEIIVFRRDLKAEESLRVEKYLQAKWGTQPLLS